MGIYEKKTKRFKNGEVVKEKYQPGEKVPENTGINFTLSSGLINSGEAPVHTRTVNFEVYGLEEQRIRIIIIDNNGKEEVYNKVHKPGDQVSTTIHSVGPTTYRVYKGKELIHEQDFRD